MNQLIKIVFCSIVILCTSIVSNAQFSTEAAKMELEKRGLTEQEVKDALMLKGIDVDNINTSDPSELAKYEKTIREVLNELEAKKKAQKSATTTPTQSENIASKSINVNKSPPVINDENVIEAIEDGATVEEAISEEIQKENNKETPQASIYGHQFFRDNTLKLFRTTEGAKVPDTYKLGPGDVVNIAIWGDSERELTQEISKEGYIKPEGQSRIFLSGLTIAEAKAVIYRSFRKFTYFNQSQIAISLITARTINVNIVGEVFNPGSFNVSAINTAINAMVAAGGPSNIGSVRNIKLISPSNGEKNIDLYKYLLNPSANETYYLAENDYIFIPVVEKVVEIKGAVNRAFKYELKANENLIALVDFAGGLKADALKKNLQILRIENDQSKIIDVDYTKVISGDFVLNNGDVVTVNKINNQVDNVVEIIGAVENEGIYEFKQGMKIGDLLTKAILKKDAIKDFVYIRRLNPDQKTRRYEIANISEIEKNGTSPSNIELERGDVVSIASTTAYVDNYIVSVEGEVRAPGDYQLDYNDDFRISDLVFLAGGVTDDVNNFAYVFRKSTENKNKIEYIYLNLENALRNNNSKDNIILKPEDKLMLYSKRAYFDESDIDVSGAVRNPSKIKYSEGITLRDAILISGGLKREASNSRIEVYRIAMNGEKKTETLVAKVAVSEDENFEKSNSFLLMPFDQIVVRNAPEFELQQNVIIEGEVKYPGKYSLLSDNTKLSDLIMQSGSYTKEAFLRGATLKRNFEKTGFVVINLEEALSNPNSKSNIIVREGDELYVPKRNTLVAISGATNASEYYPENNMFDGKINVSFDGEKRANRYLEKYAGGIADNGDRKSVIVEYPNGQVKRTKRFLFFNIYPKVMEGSHIKVYTKVIKTQEEKEKEEIDWGKVLSNSITQAVSILSLVLLLRSLD